MSNLQLVPLADIERMAVYVAESKMFPGVDTKQKATALMLLVQAENLHPMKALKRYHLMEFKGSVVPTLKAEVMLSNFQEAGGTVEWKVLTDDCVTGIFTHPKGGKVEITWDNDTVKKAGLGGLHSKFPRAMKRSRVISEGIRTIYPGCLHGMHSPEELMDVVDVTATPITLPRTAKKVVKTEESEVAEIVEAPTISKEDHSIYVDNIRTALSFIPAVRRAEVVTNLKLQYNVKSLTEITDAEKQQEVLNLITDASEPDQVATS